MITTMMALLTSKFRLNHCSQSIFNRLISLVKVEPDKKSLKIPKGGNQNLYIEEEQTIQCSKEKVLKDKQRSTKHTYKTKDRVTF